MTLDELQKHGIRVKPDASMNKWYADLIALQIAAALEPVAPPQSRTYVGGAASVRVCPICDIAGCAHIRAQQAAPPDVAQAARVNMLARAILDAQLRAFENGRIDTPDEIRAAAIRAIAEGGVE